MPADRVVRHIEPLETIDVGGPDPTPDFERIDTSVQEVAGTIPPTRPALIGRVPDTRAAIAVRHGVRSAATLGGVEPFLIGFSGLPRPLSGRLDV